MRTPVTLKIKFKSSNLDQFIERYSVDVSRGGIFIRTKEPLAVGTQLKFEFQLQDASSLISGEGTVVWIREHDPSRSGVAPGMGVRFDKLAATSQQVLDRILNEKGKRGEASMESRFDAGVRASASASGNISTQGTASQPAQHARSLPHNDFGGGDSKSHTPLPAPAPGLDSGADEFGEESTRVMQDAVVQALADKTRGDEHAAHAFGEQSETTKRASATEVAQQMAKAEAAKAEAARTAVGKVDPKPESKVEVAPETKSVNGRGDEAPAPMAPPQEMLPVVAAVPRPQQKSSALPMMAFLAVGVIAVGGYVVYRNNEEAPPPMAPKPMVHSKLIKNLEPAKPPVEPAETPEIAKPVAPPLPAGLSLPITSEPAGAQVTVNGKALEASTPTALSGLEAGKSYDVRVSLKGFHEWKTNLKAKAGETLAAKLTANEKSVEISSTPPGADVMFDGKRVGKTPFTIQKLDVTKPHEVSLKHAGFVEQKRSISSGDSWESKGEMDVLALAMTLEAEPKTTVVVRPTIKRKKTAAVPTVVTPPEEKPTPPEEKPTNVVEKLVEKPAPVEKPVEKPAPVEDKPAADKKPVEKPAADKKAVEKPADKPADKEKANLKTPSWMQDSNSDKPAQ